MRHQHSKEVVRFQVVLPFFSNFKVNLKYRKLHLKKPKKPLMTEHVQCLQQQKLITKHYISKE